MVLESTLISRKKLLIAVGLASLFASCAQRDAMAPPPALNQTVTIMPLAANPSDLSRLSQFDPMAGAAWQVQFQWDGQALSAGDIELRFYKTRGTAPALKLSWNELQAMARGVGCSPEQQASQKSASPASVLLCDGRLRIQDYSYIEAINRAGEIKSATSWGTWRVADDVMNASINFM